MKGKIVVLIDDSLVRGTTMRRLVRMMKENGAERVIVVIASPRIQHICPYGIDFKTPEQLLAVQKKSIEAIRVFIEADTLYYLSIEGLQEVGDELRGEVGDHRNFCYACFDGKYAIPV